MITINQNPNTSKDDTSKKESQNNEINPEMLKKAATNGKIADMLKNLGGKEAEKIQNLLSDKEATSKLLSTPKAQQLLKKFFGGK